MSNNYYLDKEGRFPLKPVTLESVDGAVFDYYKKKLDLKVDSPEGRRNVTIMFASGERWALIRKNKFYDENGTLILPIMSVKRMDIIRNSKLGGLPNAQKSITISKVIHPKTSNIQNLMSARRDRGLFHNPVKKTPVFETLTMPFPDFADITYQVNIWTQYQTQMNEILESIFNNFVNTGRVDTFVMPMEYDGVKPKGDSYYFMGFLEGTINKHSNEEDFTDQERIIKYSYEIKVPAYLLLDPKTEALSYGDDDNRNAILYKRQSPNTVKLTESVLTLEEYEKLYG